MVDLDLSRRAVACRGWRWMPGMRYVSDAWNRDGFDRVPERLDLVAFQAWVAELPDFRDPATRGCLLQLVREAWGKQIYAMPIYFAERITCWLAVVPDPATDEWDWTGFDGPDEVSTLIAALEAAPERKP